ncbi:hypothetical protein ACLOJK_008921 [Asimina triloba]
MALINEKQKHSPNQSPSLLQYSEGMKIMIKHLFEFGRFLLEIQRLDLENLGIAREVGHEAESCLPSNSAGEFISLEGILGRKKWLRLCSYLLSGNVMDDLAVLLENGPLASLPYLLLPTLKMAQDPSETSYRFE